MDEFTLTVSSNRYFVRIEESAAAYWASLHRDAIVDGIQGESVGILTVSQGDHVWEATVYEVGGRCHFDRLLDYLRSYVQAFDLRYPEPLVLSHKSAIRFAQREHKRPLRLRPTIADYYPGSSVYLNDARVFTHFKDQSTTEA